MTTLSPPDTNRYLVANMLATTFTVGNSNVVVMCIYIFSTNTLCGKLASEQIGRPMVGQRVVANYMSAEKLLATKTRYMYGGLSRMLWWMVSNVKPR